MPYEIVIRRTDRYDQPVKVVRKSLKAAREMALSGTADGNHKAVVTELKCVWRRNHRRRIETMGSKS
jgi:hypothetical protein